MGVTGAYVGQDGVSNGSGKSSFLMALNYSLLINELSNSELQCRKDETPFYVTSEFDIDGETCVITRGSGLFKINYKDNILTGEEAKEFLKRLLMPPEILEKLIYRPQQSEGLFIPLTSSDRYKFLYQITDLQDLEEIIINSKETLKIKEEELIKFNNNKLSLETQMSWNKDQITKINEQTKEIQNRIYAAETESISLTAPNEKDFSININSLNKQLELLKTKEPKEENFINNEILNNLEKQIVNLKELPLLSDEDIYSIKINQLNNDLKVSKDDELEKITLLNSIDKELFSQTDNLLKNELIIQEHLQNNLHPVDIKNQYEQALVAKEKTIQKRLSLQKEKCPECNNLIENYNLQSMKEKYNNELLKLEEVTSRYLNNRNAIDNIINLINQNNEFKNLINEFSNQKKIIELELNNIKHKINYFNQNIETCKNTSEIEFAHLKDKRHGQLNLLNNQLASHKERFKSDFLSEKNNWLIKLSKLEKEIDVKNDFNKKAYLEAKQAFDNKKLELKIKINSFKSEITRASENIFNFKEQMNLIQKNISDIVINIQSCEYQIKLENEICEVLGKNGFSGAYLFNILNYLTELINDNLNSIPVMDRFSVIVDSEKTLKNKETKADIDIKIYNADKEISYKSLSGGQKQALNWAIDFSIDRIITEKHNKNINFKILDEPFSALDLNGKESSLRLLKKYSGNKLILITDHGKFLNDILDEEIKIVFENQESRFCVDALSHTD